MLDQPTVRSKFLFRATAFTYFLVSVPLFSVSTVLPTISIEEAIALIVVTPMAVFVILFMTQFVTSFVTPLVIPIVTFVYLVVMVFIVSFLGGQPSSIVAQRLRPGSAIETHAIVRDPLLYIKEQHVAYFTFVFILSIAVIGIRLLTAFRAVRF